VAPKEVQGCDILLLHSVKAGFGLVFFFFKKKEKNN